MSSESIKRWRNETKRRIIDAFGGSCGVCGYNKCTAALALHHINKDTKEFSFNKIRSNPKSWDRIVAELRKCVLLCNNCHSELHAGYIELPDHILRFDESYSDYKINHADVHDCPICGKATPNNKKTCSNECAIQCTHKNRIDWSRIDVSELIKTYTIDQIATMHNISHGAVYKRLIKLGLIEKKTYTSDIIDPHTLREELSTSTYKDISTRYNINVAQLKAYAKKHKIDIDAALDKRNAKYNISVENLCIDRTTMSIAELANKYDVSVSVIRRRLKSAGF